MCFIYAVYNKQSSHVYSECYLLYLLKCVIQRKNVVWNMLFAHKFNIYEIIKKFLCLFFKLKLYLLLFFFISKKLDASFSFPEKTPPPLFPGNLPLDFWCVYLAVDASVAPNTRQVASVFGTLGSGARVIHIVGKCSDFARARCERASIVREGARSQSNRGADKGMFPGKLPPLQVSP